MTTGPTTDGAVAVSQADLGQDPGPLRLDSPLSSPANARRLDRAFAVAVASGAGGILLDLRGLPSDVATLDAFAMAERLARAAAARRLRIALLVGKADSAEGRFIETVCVNRGGLAQRFSDSSDAVAWLRNGVAGAAAGEVPQEAHSGADAMGRT